MEVSAIEKELYGFIEKNIEVTIETIKKQLSEKHVGALGKLIQGNKIEKYKKRQTEESGYSKMITYYGLKKEKNTDVST